MIDVPELLAKSLEDRSIEAAVLCIEGCGTSIINDPAVIRRAGAFISGADNTVPDIEIISIVGDDNILDPETGKVDNVEGLCVVYDNGIHMAAASTGSLKEAQMMRDMFGSDLLVIGFFKEFSDKDRTDSEGLLDILVTDAGAEAVSQLGRGFSNKG
jgi:hypothetical protein